MTIYKKNITQRKQMRMISYTLSVFLLLLAMPFAMASGVSSPYWDQPDNKNPFYIQPGETKDMQFILQNGGTTQEDVLFKARILQGSEIAEIIDATQEYLVPAGRTDIPVYVRFTIPSNTPIDTTYRMRFEFISSPATETGSLQFGSGFVQQFDVIVGVKPVPGLAPETAPETEEEKLSPWLIILIIIAIIITIIIIIVFLQKRRLKNQPKLSKGNS